MNKKRIGIWGFGKVGKSAVSYFLHKNYAIEVLDKRELTAQEKMFLEKHNIAYRRQKNLEQFLQRNYIILPSPGIDLRNFQRYEQKFICELDILQKEFCKPIIGITGSVGKTTITNIVDQTLQSQSINVWTGGNIGTPMLNLIKEKDYVDNIDIALLELSSFQLDLCKIFCPDIAVWTNFFPNHLDRHTNLDAYFQAKKKLIINQNKNQYALLPIEIIDTLQPLEQYKSKIYFFSNKRPTDNLIKKLRTKDQLLYAQKNKIFKISRHDNTETEIATIDNSDNFIFQENLLIIYSIFYIIKKYYELSETNLQKLKLQQLEHRLEKFCTINGIVFYNDSKSTTPASTIAAVKKLSDKPIILLLGGLSKGVDRSPLIKKIKPYVKRIVSFGKESEILKKLCNNENIPCSSFKKLQQAVIYSFTYAVTGDQILLSPSGSSFDLFENYILRGNHFKQVVRQIKELQLR